MYRPSPIKLGHIVLWVRDIHASAKFYEEIVGLTVSDWISDRMVFMRAGEDHHDMALAQLPENAPERIPGTPGLEHFSYMIESFEEMERAIAMLQDRGVQIDRGPGKHGAGENCFIVFKDPDGNNVEFYCDMLQITEDNPYEASVWRDGIEAFDQWHLKKFVVPPPARFKNQDFD
jgi:catechol-2,3-dioxygenase